MICYIDFILYFFGFSLLLSVDFLQSCFVSTYVFCTIIVKHIICIYISPTKQQYNTIYRYFFFTQEQKKELSSCIVFCNYLHNRLHWYFLLYHLDLNYCLISLTFGWKNFFYISCKEGVLPMCSLNFSLSGMSLFCLYFKKILLLDC